MNEIYNVDCMEYMQTMNDCTVDFTLTDIPYEHVNKNATRGNDAIRNIDKGLADEKNFDLNVFLDEVYRVTKTTICIFCGNEQFSTIYSYFKNKRGGTRPIVWKKTNPSPLNGQHMYLSGTEFCVWHKKASGSGTFNAFCKSNVLTFPAGKSKIHPTEKNHALLKDLILDNTNENDIVFDPCAGSGSTILCAIELGRKAYGCELHKEFYDKAMQRIDKQKMIDSQKLF